jgi:hypothetical protein
VYIDLFDELDESLQASLQEGCVKYAPGIESKYSLCTVLIVDSYRCSSNQTQDPVSLRKDVANYVVKLFVVTMSE